MKYELLSQRGALQEGVGGDAQMGSTANFLSSRTPLYSGNPLGRQVRVDDLSKRKIPHKLLELVPADVALELQVLPLEFDGERLILAAADPDNIAKADTLRFRLALDVRLIAAPKPDILQAIVRHYRGAARFERESAALAATGDWTGVPQTFTATASLEQDTVDATRRMARGPMVAGPSQARHMTRRLAGQKPLSRNRGAGMFFFTVAEGERVLVTHWNGRREVIAGPRNVWAAFKTFRELERHVAHPGEFLMLRFLDGRQEHLIGPAEMWADPRVHESITKQECLQLAAKEAVVVYRQEETTAATPTTAATTRRIVYGPTLFAPQPGEWLHTFSWHASRGGSRGVEKVPNALVFQKLWLMPDQMYHDVFDVRTADSAVITIKLMIFFELIDINRMLDNTHDPIGEIGRASGRERV